MQTHETSNLLYDLLTEPCFRPVRHLLFIAVLICVAFGQSFFVFGSQREALGNHVYFFVITLTVVYIALAYFNLYYLVPSLLLKNKYVEYFLLLIGMTALILAAKYMAESRILASVGVERTFNGVTLLDNLSNLILTTICIAGSLITVLFQQWITDSNRIDDLKNKQLKSSITELKEHINPDFLFRIIRYASEEVKAEPEKVSGMLFKLSELLRYELYDCKRGQVLLKSDIDFVNAYLLLEQQLRDNFTCDLSVIGQANHFIRPFVFMPFIQDILKRNPAHLSIRFRIEPDLTELECTITEHTASESTTLCLKYAE